MSARKSNQSIPMAALPGYRLPRLRPVCQAVALMLAASATVSVQAATNLANLGAQMTAARNAAGAVGGTQLGISAQQALQASQPSIQNLAHAAQGLAQQMAAQQAAATAAINTASSVPNGLTPGGLQLAPGVSGDMSNPALWLNANAPTQSVDSNGHVNVDVKQTAQKAVLTWQTMNIGRQTTLNFDQSAGTQSSGANDWIVLNRIQDPSGAPSQILGNITAQGSVYVINRNGIIFGAGSQVNVHSLLASSLDLFSSDNSKSNAFFLQNGIGQINDPNHMLTQNATIDGFLVDGVSADGTTTGAITVEQGASIKTGAQGYALLAAPNVTQAGSIVADDGQVVLVANGQVAYIASPNGEGRFSVDGGNNNDSGVPGEILNTGLIQARRGNVQWFGNNLVQNGVVVVSTSLTEPGSIVFDSYQLTNNTAASGILPGKGNVSLGSGSITAVLPDEDDETTSSSATANAAFKTGSIALSGNTVTLNGTALIEAPGADVSLTTSATNVGVGRVYLDNGAIIDVSGLADVELPMSALLVTIPRIGQNELADSPLQRNGFLFDQQNLVIDSTQSGIRADGFNWIGSPVLNVAGYVENIPRSIDQLLTTGGNITLVGDQVIARTGSQMLLNGGYVAYQPGWVTTPNLLGANGRVYSIDNADPDMTYVGFAGQFTETHARWGVTKTWSNPLVAGFSRWDAGFIQGYDAGTLTIEPSSGFLQPILDGSISAQALTGRNQAEQGDAPQGGSLVIENINLSLQPTEIGSTSGAVNFLVSNQAVPLEDWQPGFAADTPLTDLGDGNFSDASDPFYWRTLSATMLNNAGLSSLTLESGGTIRVDSGTTLSVQPGGSIELTAPALDVEGTLRAPSGKLTLNSFAGIASFAVSGAVIAPQTLSALTVGPAGRLDASGLFVNDSASMTDPMTDPMTGSEFVNGGSITLSAWKGGGSDSADFTGNIDLQGGSVLDVSSGAYVGADGRLALQNGVPLGKGGDITIGTHDDGVTNYITSGGGATTAPANLLGGQIILDGTLLANGFSGGGTLSLHAPQIQIGGTPAPSPDAALLYLSPGFFQGQGFSRYQLTADTDAAIAPGTVVQVQPSYLLPNDQALVTAPTGTHLDTTDAANPSERYATVGTLDPYQRWLLAGDSAGFSLVTGGYLAWEGFQNGGKAPPYTGVNGSLLLGEGATIGVDAGATVALSAANQLTVLGTVRAPGGTIALNNLSASTTTPADSIWLGSNSALDASGTVLTNPQAAAVLGAKGQFFVPDTGKVLDGGTVSLISDGYVLAQSGALIDVSGTRSVFDLPMEAQGLGLQRGGYAPAAVWSNAGSIVLAASAGMLFDATLQAQAGAPEADGGSLTIAGVDSFAGTSAVAQPRAIVLQASGDLLPAGLAPGETVEPGLSRPSGVLHFAADRLDGSGITSLSIGPTPGDSTSESRYDVVELLFSGDVNLTLGRSFTADASAYVALPAGVTTMPTAPVAGAGTTSISAPYVFLAGTPAGSPAPVAIAGDGTLKVRADFMDLGGDLLLQGFAQAGFASTGDLRFYLPAVDVYVNGQPRTGWLYSPGNLEFAASRIYPASDYRFLIDADPQGDGPDGTPNQTTVTFNGNGTPGSGTPLSAGGTLAVAASQIVQGGTLWVPSGSIVLGVTDPQAELTSLGLATTFPLSVTQNVQLSSGSITSVSLNGAVLPFGSTVDGTDWSYDGDVRVLTPDLGAPPAKQITIGGTVVSLDAGATVDVSGGGDLQAQEWVPGTGGTRNVLVQTETNTDGSTTPQYADGRAIYAIVPGYSAPVGAYDAALANGAGAGPAVGQAVYLSDVPGLPAGVYTLLPAGYATLKGAYRVVQNTGTGQVVPGTSMTLPDGTVVTSGYFTDALTGARGAETSFQVQSGPVWQQYSQYTLTSANSYFKTQAEHAGTVAPLLPADAGHLALEATDTLSLDTTLTAATVPGGRGAEVDIAGQAIQIVSPGDRGLSGYLQIDADGLTGLGAASLLIGGIRSASDEGDVLDVTANSVVLSNDAAHPLSGPEVILVANGQGAGIDLTAGSVLQAGGALTDADTVPLVIGSAATATTPAVSGDGVLVRVTNGTAAPITRHDVTGIDGPAGVAGGALTIAVGAVLDGGQSLSLDATGNTQVDGGAVLNAHAIDFTVNRISFVDGTGGPGGPGEASSLQIGPDTLAQFGAADSVILRSRSTIDFLGNIDATFGQSLTLDAAALTSDGGTVNLNAGRLVLANDLPGNPTTSFTAGGGQLNISVGELDFGSGATTLQGFGRVTGQASQGIAAQGSGSVDFGNLDVSLSAPVVLIDTGADLSLTTTGALSLGRSTGTPLVRQALGGTLVMTGGSVTVSTDVSAPGGTLTVSATAGDLTLNDGAQLSVAGVTKGFNDTQAYVPGGALTLVAETGNIEVAPGSTLDVAGDAAGGNAGRLVVQAAAGTASLQGRLLGTAASGYLGGNLVLQTAGAVDLDSLADSMGTGGMNGTVLIQVGAGDLVLDAGHTLSAHGVTLVADGGTGGAAGGQVRIDGTVDASGTFGSPIDLYGKGGVDIEGALLANATAPGGVGGDITLGTIGTSDGTLNAAYGYENVLAADSGTIHIRSTARLDLSGSGGNGNLSLRAPLLTNGDVNVSIDSGATLTGVAGVSLEAFATWSTADTQQSNQAKYFDGLIDPAGWFTYDASGKVQQVAGTWTDTQGNPVVAPDPNNSTQMAAYLAEYAFTPSAANTNHQSFYGYLNGDASQGPGTLMGFVEAPGFTFESRFAGLPNFHALPGIELVNPSQTVNNGDITVLTNWNLGAGTTDGGGMVHLAYRYRDQAPVLSVLADNNLVIQASVTDGFFQVGNVAAQAAPAVASFMLASEAYEELLNVTTGLGAFGLDPSIIFAPADLDASGGSPQAINEYYGQYVAYAGYLNSPSLGLPDLTGFGDGTNGRPLDIIGFGVEGGVPPISVPSAPLPPAAPINLNQYPAYLSSYGKYLVQAAADADFTETFALPDTFQLLAAPPTTLDLIVPPPPPVDNSPSPQRTLTNPVPLLSATLTGGSSSTYRLVAGANTSSADPLAVQAAALVNNPANGLSGTVSLDGHTDYADPNTGRVLYAPTLVRTGTGSIDIAAAGDIQWLDNTAPAAVYTAGAPAPGTTTGTTVSILSAPFGTAEAELVVTAAVNPVGGGNVSLSAGDDIEGIQQVIDTDGSATGVAGTSMAQYWWPWMQTGNSVDGSRSSINFGAFDQGVMSVGGNVVVTAGGDIRNLSVSLPTTWYANADNTAITTVGGGNLTVRAGGNILSGTYFVAKGEGTISAGGSIGSDLDYTADVASVQGFVVPTTTPVATLLGMQDATLQIEAGGSVNIGGVYNPSWIDSNSLDMFLPAGHADGQSYSTASSLSVLAAGGTLTYGSLSIPVSLFVPGIPPDGIAGNVLPATVNFTAASGDIDILAAGELYPSAQGNLNLLANGSISFVDAENRFQSQSQSWGLIDAPASSLPSPLDLGGLLGPATVTAVPFIEGYINPGNDGIPAYAQYLHQVIPLHGDDSTPVRIYALGGDIVDGIGTGGGAGNLLIAPAKPALIQAGGDIVDLAFLGQQTHASDVTLISAGRDIVDTALVASSAPAVTVIGPGILPVILEMGPGTLVVQAGRDIGPLSSQTQYYAVGVGQRNDVPLTLGPRSSPALTGIETIGNGDSPYLPDESANIQVEYGIGPGVEQADFIARYIDPSASVTGVPSFTPDMVAFMERYQQGQAVDTGLVANQVAVNLTPGQAWTQFQALPDYVQRLFVEKVLFTILTDVGSDYNNPSSAFFHQYARGYAAIATLFPASLGYTNNGSGQGGINGAQQTVDTGDLDIRGSTIQTQQGGDIGILAPGGQALIGSTGAPSQITDVTGKQVLAGPNTMGILTLRQGDVDIFTDRSVLLAQSRIFTEQGGDMTIWSSNGDINAGQGAKTTSELATATFLCTPDAWCQLNPSGEVSGAGIGTLQTIPDAPAGNVFLMAPRGTVDAGDAGIRVSGNLVVAAAQVTNADNIQVQGKSTGIPIEATVDTGALTAASSAASAATQMAQNLVRTNASGVPQRHWIITVQVEGFGDSNDDDEGGHRKRKPGPVSYNPSSEVSVLGFGKMGDTQHAYLTKEEQSALGGGI